MGIFRLYSGLKMSIENKSVRKNPFLSACFCWDSRLSFREIDQNYKYGRTIVYANSYLEFLFRHFKIFRAPAILQDAAGAVRAHCVKGTGYCYMIGRGPSSCLLGHVTGLLFCLCVKIFLPSSFNSVVFWNSMSLNVLDIELNEKDIIKELGIYIDGSLQGFSFCPPKFCKPNKQTIWNTSHLHGIAWSIGKLNYDVVSYDIKVKNAEVVAEGLEKCRLLTRLLRQNVEILDDFCCPKIQHLVGEEKTDRSWIYSSYLLQHKTRLHCAKNKAKVFGQWAMQLL